MKQISDLPAPRAILFDWDNTLVDTWPIIHDALNATFTAFGLETWEMETTKSRVRKSMRDSFPEIFGDQWEKAGAMYQDQYRANHLRRLTPLPGAEGILKHLQAKGLPLGVVSNKKGVSLRQEVTHLGWEGYFTSIVGSDDAARDKPSPDPVHLALSELEIPVGPDIWFIGDSDIDLDCAAQAGCTAILFGDHAPTQKEAYTPTHYKGFAYSRHPLDHSELLALLS